jgi:hypothetical protein
MGAEASGRTNRYIEAAMQWYTGEAKLWAAWQLPQSFAELWND